MTPRSPSPRPFAAETAGSTPPPVEFHLHPGVLHEFDFIAFNSAAARRVIADRDRAALEQY